MKKLFVLLMLAPLFALAQTGMHFEHNTTWKDIKAKAKAEKKFIFVDAFTTWCGPCKYMAANIFPTEEAGNFFNKNYINVKVQLDTTKSDNEEVKAWYADAHKIMTDYKVNVFPTYLFFDPNGNLVHRAVGSSDVAKFISKGENAMNPEKQYYTLLGKYKGGNKQPEFLRGLTYAAADAYDMEMIGTASSEYLGTQKDYFNTDNIDFLTKFTTSSKNRGFEIISQNADRYDKVKGEGAASKKIVEILTEEELFPVLFSRKGDKPDLQKLSETLNAKYPKYADELFLTGKVMYYQNNGDWNNFQTTILEYMNKYGGKATPAELNNYAWTVFENCKDMTCVEQALAWSKRSFKDKEDPMFLDTYANLLYRTGKKDEAIRWEEKAVALASPDQRKDYQDVLDKMKKGEKTWKD